MLVDGLSRKGLQDLAVETLRAAQTIAGPNVFAPRDWPTTPDKFPILLVQVPTERKVSVTRGQAQFLTTMTLVTVGRMVGNDPYQLEAALDCFADQVEDALLSTTDFISQIQQFSSVEMQMAVSAEARMHIGEFGLKFEIEVPQLYVPGGGVPLTDVRGTITSQATGGTLAVADVPLQG